MLKYEWVNSLNKIEEKDWASIYGNSVLDKINFHQSLINSKIPNATFSFLLIYDENTIIAIVPCFNYKISIDVIAGKLIKQIVKSIRCFFPSFGYLNFLGLGSIVATCKHHIGIKNEVSGDVLKNLTSIIRRQIKDKAISINASIVLIKEIQETEKDFIHKIFDENLYLYPSLPSSYIPICKLTIPYPSALRRKERYRYRKIKSQFEENFSWEITSNFTKYTPIFYEYYKNTLEKSSFKFEELNKAFFENITSTLKDDLFYIIAKDSNDICHAIGLVIIEEDSLIPIYLGLNYNNKSEILKILHINSLFRVIEEGEKRSKKLVVLGQTGYYNKILCGALLQENYLGFIPLSFFSKFLVKNILPFLFKKRDYMKSVYIPNVRCEIKNIYNDFGMIWNN